MRRKEADTQGRFGYMLEPLFLKWMQSSKYVTNVKIFERSQSAGKSLNS